VPIPISLSSVNERADSPHFFFFGQSGQPGTFPLVLHNSFLSVLWTDEIRPDFRSVDTYLSAFTCPSFMGPSILGLGVGSVKRDFFCRRGIECLLLF